METAQLAILVTGAVGLGAPALTAIFSMLRAKQDDRRARVQQDLADLRTLLDALLPIMFEHTTNLVANERWMRDETASPEEPRQ